MRIIFSTMVAVVFAIIFTEQALAAPTETILYKFPRSSVGSYAGLIIDNQGALYGTIVGGGGNGCPQFGTGGCGTVFKLAPPGKGQTTWTETILYSFKGGNDGTQPWAGLISDNQDILYGTTVGGGNDCPQVSPDGCGTVFKLTPPGKGQTVWTETVLYSFKGGSDGSGPFASLIIDKKGALYGTTYGGGNGASVGAGWGTVFKLTPPGKGQNTWTETVLYRFNGGSDGINPVANLLMDNQGALYGTTFGGGNSCLGIGSCGTVFKLALPAKGQTVWTETVLYSFKGGSDGAQPRASLIADNQGALYGTTVGGGVGNDNAAGCLGSFNNISLGCGTVFKLAPPAKGQTVWTETILHNFLGSDGAQPWSGLIFNDQKNVLMVQLGKVEILTQNRNMVQFLN